MSSELSFFGEHLIVGLNGTTLQPAEKKLLKELSPLGIILFAKNVEQKADGGWTGAFIDLVNRAADLAGRPDFIVSIDHEGGRVHRFPSTLTRFSAARLWEEYSRDVGLAMGTELAALGITTSFAPVLDVHSEESNPVIGERALSSDPVEVATRGLAVFHGLEAAGVLACGKHFPGHGATLQDSHHELPKLDLDLDTLRERELLPFQGLANAGIPLMMSAHVLYPEIDANFPATLSPYILGELLRFELEFTGALITDDLEMKALSHYTPGQKAALALQAGNDLLLEANPTKEIALEVGEAMLRAVAKEVDAGKLNLEASNARLKALMEYHRKLEPVRAKSKNHLALLGSKPHEELAQLVGARVFKLEPV